MLSCISEGEIYYQNDYLPTYYNYVIFMVTISRQDKHEPSGRLAHSLVISDYIHFIPDGTGMLTVFIDLMGILVCVQKLRDIDS